MKLPAIRKPAARRAAWLLAMGVLGACAPADLPPPAGVPVYDFLDGFTPRNAGSERHLFEFDGSEPLGGQAAGWSFAEQSGKSSTTWATGLESRLELYLVAARDVDFEMRVAPLVLEGIPSQTLDILVNDRSITSLTLSPRWQTYRAEVPAEALRAGTNDLRFRYAWARQPQGGEDPRELSVAWDWLRIGPGANEAPAPRVEGAGLLLPLFSRADYFLEVRPGSQLDLGSVDSLLPDGSKARGRLEIEVETRGEPARIVFAGLPDGALRVPLEVPYPRLARISFRVVPAPAGWLDRLLPGVRPASAALSRSGLALRSPVLRAPEHPAGEIVRSDTTAGARGRPNVIIYLIDTLRADHLGCYGYEREVSPNIDRFAAEAILFTNPFAPASWTRASVASLFTGLYPRSHRAVDRKSRLEPSFTTLAEALREQGYDTAAFVTNGNLSSKFGTDQGFDHYESLRETRTRHVHLLSDQLNESAFDWLEARTGESPFFLYLHATDPHAPYTPKEPWRTRFAADADASLGTLSKVRRVHQWGIRTQRAIREHVIPLYDAEIAQNDASFGALVARLRERGLYDDAIVILLADHGEEFLDHGGWKHGHTLYQEQLRVPFIVKLPGNTQAGRRLDVPVSLVDVMPTLLEWVGAPLPAEIEGRSLIPAFDGDRTLHERTVLAHILLDRREKHAVVVDGQKLIRSMRPRGDLELFALDQDPAERRDLAGEEPLLAGFLETELDRYMGPGEVTAAPDAEIDPAVEERLRALGYLQ